MKHVLIINPVSGLHDVSEKIIPQFKNALLGQSFAVEITKFHGHAAQLTREYASAGDAVRFYVCGGDGTLNEAIFGCYGYNNAEIACIPYGSGNDFIRNFGNKTEFQDIAATAEGTAVDIDLVLTNNGICAAIASVGIDADVAFNIPIFRRLPFCGGNMAYNLSIIKALCKRMGRKLNIEIDGKRLQGNYLLVAICNGKSYGGGFNAAPSADLTDGLLDVILVKKISRFRISKVLSLYKKGKHLENNVVIPIMNDFMTFKRARAVSISPQDGKKLIVNIDGECEAATQLNVTIMPLSGRFVLPKGVFDRYKQKISAV